MRKYITNLKIVLNKKHHTIKFYNFFDYFFDGQSQSLFSNEFFKRLFRLTGFLTFKKFKRAIENYVFDENQSLSRKSFLKIPALSKKVELLVKKETFQCLRRLDLQSHFIKIVFFPAFSNYLKDNLDGVSAYTVPSGKMFFIFLHYELNLESKAVLRLQRSIVHELNHLIFDERHKSWEGVIGSIIEEGLAGHFEAFVHQKPPEPFFRKVSKERCLKLWPKVKKILYSYDLKDNDRLFVYSNKYFPDDFGYSLGYQIVGDFLKKNKGLSWREIMKMSSQEILEKSGWPEK